MKNLLSLLVVIVMLVSLASCTKEEIIVIENTGIQVVDELHPLPVALSDNTYECWVDSTVFRTAKEIRQACEESWDEYDDNWYSYNCGMWRTVVVKKYFGTLNEIRYVSKETITLVVDQETYRDGRDLSERLGTIKGTFYNMSNPVNQNYMRLAYLQPL